MEEQTKLSTWDNIKMTTIAFVKGLNPRRFYHGVGKASFYEFILFVVFMLFFYGPLANSIMLAFANTYNYPEIIPQDLGFQWWEFVFGQDSLVQSILSSFLIATITTIIGLLIGLPAAYALARFNFKWKNGVMFSILLTNAFPKIGLYTAMGIIFYRFNLMGTLAGVIIIHLINSLIFLIWLPAGAFRNVHINAEEAARDVGAGPFMTFARISLPLAAPGIAVSAMYTFLGSLEEAQGTLLVGFPEVNTMATSMYGVILDYPATAGAVFALVIMIPSIIIVFVFRKYLTPESLSQK